MGPNKETRHESRPAEAAPGGKNPASGNGESKPKGTAAPVQFPTLSLPKGGGAIQGIGEKFQANPVTGTGSMSVPIAVSPGRSGFAPQLALSYDSGAGNSAFGLGWDVGLPSISRKTQKGLPQYDGLPKYQDTAGQDSDVFLISGAEDLVPVLKIDGSRKVVETVPGFKIYPYRPRIEGLFAKIEKWVRMADGDTHWRATTKDNLTSIYGPDTGSRIADPEAQHKVFSWLLERTLDHKGNVMLYEYKPEDLAGVERTIFEKNRTPGNTTAQKHLKKVKYGNTKPYSWGLNDPVIADFDPDNDWLFELVFDYGEHADSNGLPQYEPPQDATWLARKDAFSSYRAGFEIRDYRLCQRILMFHRFLELDTNPYLVKATLLEYDENEIATQLNSVTHAGYLTDNGVTTIKKFPPIVFKYTKQKIDNTIYSIAASDLPNAPEGIDGKRYLFTDLYNEGVSGILSQSENAWYYKRNLGDGRFGPKEVVQKRPVPAGAGVADYEGNGLNDYVLQNGGLNGYFEMDDLDEWQPFRTFTDVPNIDWDDPNLRSMDLDGDGIADLLLTENDCFIWYPSKAKEGFDPARRVSKALDEEQGPRIVFQEAFQTIFLADLSGSGMTDICRIRNGEVCYWPNLGYGRFGAKVTMAKAPHFDTPDAFDPARLRVADIDGSGTTDIIYLGNGQLSYWINRSGNSWEGRQTVPGFPLTTPLHSVQAMDLLGNGTSCIVWSSPLPGEANAPLRYIQLMGKTEKEGNKPYLLKEVDNNMGAVTRLKYESSTRFYLDDRKAGRPWITKLPFPVQVLTKQEVYDAISDTHFVTKFAYHHGYFDPAEREFRGFGMVEQWDTEDYDSFKEQALFSAKAYNWSEDSFIPPIHTKTWFHNGFYRQGGKVTRQYESEYYGARDANGNFTEWTLEDSALPAGLSGDVAREAARALKGRPLRVEAYGLDEHFLFQIGIDNNNKPVAGTINIVWKNAFTSAGINFQNDIVKVKFISTGTWEVLNESKNWRYKIVKKDNFYKVFDIELSTRPYTATESNYQIKVVQLQGDNRHSIFFAAENETLTFQYERNPADPRVAHSFALEIDDFGNPLRSLAVVYPRRGTPDYDEQKALYCTLTEAKFINKPNEPGFYRIGVPYEQKLFELTGFEFLNKKFERQEICDGVMTAVEIAFEDDATTGFKKRLVQWAKTRFYNDDLSGYLPAGEIAHHGLPFKAFEAAYSDAQLEKWFGATKISDNEAAMVGAGFVKPDDYQLQPIAQNPPDHTRFYWRPSGQVIFDAAQFYLPKKQKDIFGQVTELEYDDYGLLPKRSFTEINTVLLETKADFDYRTLQPKRLTDPNGNRSVAVFDALGMVTHTSVMGKAGENIGDADLLDPTIFQPIAFVDGLELRDTAVDLPHDLLMGAGSFFYYNLHNWRFNNEPNYAMSIARETHPADPGDPATFGASKVQMAFAYSDGFGRQVMMKVQAESGDALVYNNGQLTTEHADPRWVGNGRTVFNNKGKPVKQYEPYFSKTFEYENETALVEYGVTPVLHYDPAGRVVRTDMPDGTFSKVEFTPWEQRSFDQNDTVLDSDWYKRRTDNTRADYIADTYEQRAATLAQAHANTPKTEHLDTLGRVFLLQDHNGFVGNTPQLINTRFKLDIEGNQQEVTDAKGRLITVNTFNLTGEPVFTWSMDGGKRWMLTNALGNPLYAWNERGFRTRMVYDALQRNTGVFVKENTGPEEQVVKIMYGEEHGAPETLNLLGQVWRLYDQSGLLESEAFDFKGNPLRAVRKVAEDYKNRLDWSAAPVLENETFNTVIEYDALNRPRQSAAPDGSVTVYTYNEASFLEKLDVTHGRTGQNIPAVQSIAYDAKGQRTEIRYGNGVITRYEYDPLTFRLTRLWSTRNNGTALVQDLKYYYDPVGNITDQRDDAQQAIFFANHIVEPHGVYTYDALYRLIRAEGREHIGQTSGKPQEESQEFINFPHPNDGQAMRRYIESYLYDELGNILEVNHQAGNGTNFQNSWVRTYTYDKPHPTQSGKMTNRLGKTTLLGNDYAYEYDVHGNMTIMPHLPKMDWDFADQLKEVHTLGGNREYYTYTVGGGKDFGVRARKVTEKAGGKICDRIYIGDFEVYRERTLANGVELERETLHILDDKGRIALIDTATIENSSFITHPSSLQRYQLSNHLGSATLETDGAGELISYEEYYPFGASSYRAGRSEIEVSLKRYRYVGKERDEETGLDYYGARYYAAWLCRFVSVDALKDEYPFYSVYQYAGNMPISFIDLDGLEPNKDKNRHNKPIEKYLYTWPSSNNTARTEALSLSSSNYTVGVTDAPSPLPPPKSDIGYIPLEYNGEKYGLSYSTSGTAKGELTLKLATGKKELAAPYIGVKLSGEGTFEASSKSPSIKADGKFDLSAIAGVESDLMKYLGKGSKFELSYSIVNNKGKDDVSFKYKKKIADKEEKFLLYKDKNKDKEATQTESSGREFTIELPKWSSNGDTIYFKGGGNVYASAKASIPLPILPAVRFEPEIKGTVNVDFKVAFFKVGVDAQKSQVNNTNKSNNNINTIKYETKLLGGLEDTNYREQQNLKQRYQYILR